MMKSIFNLLLFFFVSTSNITSAQQDTLFVRYDTHLSDSVEYTTDTLFRKMPFGPHYLFETAWITNTRNQLSVLGYGMRARSASSDCVDDGIESGENKLISLDKTDSSIVVKYRVVSNCCFAFLCDMEVIDSNTLNLIHIDYGSICGCTCYHDLTYEIAVDFIDEKYEHNFNQLEFITLNGELKSRFE